MRDDKPKTLSKAKLEALKAIASYRRQRRIGTGWIVGDKRLSSSLVASLEADTLVREITVFGTPVLVVTDNGKHQLT